MKKISLLTVLTALLTVALPGCGEEAIIIDQPLSNENAQSNAGGTVLTITASMPDSKTSNPSTRIVLTREEGELNINPVWEVGDQVELVVVGETTIQNPVIAIDPLDNKKATFSVTLPDNPTYPLTIRGIYGGGGIDPDNPAQALLPTVANSFGESLAELSTKKSMMLKFTVVVENEDASPQVTLEHVGSFFSVELRNTGSAEWTGIESIELSSSGTIGAYIGGTLDLATGTVTGSTGNTITFPTTSTSLGIGETKEFWGWMVPSDAAAWPAMTFKVNGNIEMTTSPVRATPTEVGKAYYLKAGHISASYHLSEDGKTLINWFGSESIIDMNSDYKLREVTTVADYGFTPSVGTPPSSPNDQIKKEIIVGEKVTSIGDRAFSRRGALERVVLSPVLETMGPWVFQQCTSLTFLELPATLTTLTGTAHFNTTTALTTMVCHATIPPSGLTSQPFAGSGMLQEGSVFYVPRNSINAYKEHALWRGPAATPINYRAIEDML